MTSGNRGIVVRVGVFLSIALAVLVVAGCGGAKVTTTTNAQGQRVLTCAGHVRFAKTKFVLHSGLAFGAFHRYILKPYRAGSFKKGAPGRAKAFAKAGAAALFAYHELKVARNNAICDGSALRSLATSLSDALGSLRSLASLKSGVGLGAIATAASAFGSLGSQAASKGAPIKDLSR